jgi:hypothetical protein
MISYISKKMSPVLNGALPKFLCCLALVFTTMFFTSCTKDKSDASLELTVKAAGLVVSNFAVTLKTGSTSNTVSSNLNGIALFTGLSGGDYTASWPATTLTFTNGNRVLVVAGSQNFSISSGEAQTRTLTIN